MGGGRLNTHVGAAPSMDQRRGDATGRRLCSGHDTGLARKDRIRHKLPFPILFILVISCASVYTTTLVLTSSLLLAPYVEFTWHDLATTLGILWLVLFIVTIFGGCLVVAHDWLGNRLKKIYGAVFLKIDDGNFNRWESAIFLSVGTVIVFWLQFSGVLLLDFTDKRGEAATLMKGINDKGSMFIPGTGACQGRHCIGCLSVRQHKLSKKIRGWRTL